MPKITAIKEQVKRTDRYSIYVDSKYRFSLSEAEVARLGIFQDQELTEQELEKLKTDAVQDKALDRSLRYIAIRARSQFEITDYLKRKGYDREIVLTIVSKLNELNLIDDEAFARQWVEWRQMGRPRSRRQLQTELFKKRVDRQVIEDVLAEVEPETELQQLKDLIERKSRLSQYQDRQKLMAYLARQGYPYDLIKRAFSED